MHSELDQLRRENARLIGLLEAQGIAWRSSGTAPAEPAPISEAARGRDDVYALRWQSNSSGRSGYAPACVNEWRPGLCEKPRISCRDCNHRELLPLSDPAIYGHLAGDHTIGLYPLLDNDHCHLLAVDFDQQDWRDDARAGASILPTNTITTPMAFRDAATANGSFDAVTDGPPLLGRLNLGLQLYKGKAIEARAEYGLQADSGYWDQRVGAKLLYRF
jgi:hypothetical protein